MKGTEKCNIQFAFGVPARQLKSGLHRLGTGISEIYPFGRPTGGHSRQFFRQNNLGGVIKISAGHMQKPIGLGFNGFNDFRMTVTGGVGCNTGGKIKKDIAVHVMHPEPLGFLYNQRINPRVGRGNKGLIEFNQFLGPGSGQRSFYLR